MNGDDLAPLDFNTVTVGAVLTLPVLQCSKPGQKVAFKILEPIHQGQKMKGDDKKEPANVAAVHDLMNGGRAQFIFSAVVKNEIEAKFPNASYVGVMFAVEALEKPEGKKFRPYRVVVIEPKKAA